jgi:hypothetical protein
MYYIESHFYRSAERPSFVGEKRAMFARLYGSSIESPASQRLLHRCAAILQPPQSAHRFYDFLRRIPRFFLIREAQPLAATPSLASTRATFPT